MRQLECRQYSSGIDGCALEPGDILVDRGADDNRVTQFDSALGDTYWTHAAIVLGYMNLDRDDPDARPETASTFARNRQPTMTLTASY